MNDFWANSVELMLLGMGTVFVFLSLLVVGVTLMSAVINKISKAEITPPQHTPTIPDAEVAAVAASAWAKSQTN